MPRLPALDAPASVFTAMDRILEPVAPHEAYLA